MSDSFQVGDFNGGMLATVLSFESQMLELPPEINEGDLTIQNMHSKISVY